MTEHNHRRNSRSTDDHKTRWRGWRKNLRAITSELVPQGVGAKGFGVPDGPTDAARCNQGEKKFERTRFRFREKMAVRRLAKNPDPD